MSKVSIEYSIVSRGTEKYNNCGYMAISKIYNSNRYILNVDHNIKNAILNINCLKAKSCYNIANIVFSRFQLITALTFERLKYRINDNVLLLGLRMLCIESFPLLSVLIINLKILLFMSEIKTIRYLVY